MPPKVTLLFLAPGSAPGTGLPAQEVPVILDALAKPPYNLAAGVDFVKSVHYHGRKKGKPPKTLRMDHHIIVAGNTKMAEAAKERMPTTPLVVALTGEPDLKNKLVSLYGSPDCATGVLDFDDMMATEQVDMLRSLLNTPDGAKLRVGVLYNNDNALGKNAELAKLKALEGSQLSEARACDVSTTGGVAAAMSKARSDPAVDAVIVLGDPITVGQVAAIHAAAMQAPKLPVMYSWPEAARDGGLFGYGPVHVEIFAKAAPLIGDLIKALKAGTLSYPLPKLQPSPAAKLWVNKNSAAAFDPALTVATLQARLGAYGPTLGPSFP